MQPVYCFVLFHFASNTKKFIFKSILIDTHNDIPSTAIEKGVSFDQDLKTKTHSDLQRMKEGGVDAQLFSIWCDGNKLNPYAWANREIIFKQRLSPWPWCIGEGRFACFLAGSFDSLH